MKKQYVDVKISIPEEQIENALFVLMDYTFTGIVENYDEITITFSKNYWSETIKNNLVNSLNDIGIDALITDVTTINDKNWNEDWEKNLQPVIINENIAITPSRKEKEINAPLKIIINPKMSFGTGEHETTRLICKLMEKNLRHDTFWIDAGTGTGVLAILAIKLGASSVYAFDNNEWSIDNAKENFELNNVTDKIELDQLDIESSSLPEADGVIANLFTHLVVASFPEFYKSLNNKKGLLLCSGILKYDKDYVLNKAENAGFKLIDSIVENEWIAFHFKAV